MARVTDRVAVMLVDDEVDLAEMLARAVTVHGYQPVVCSSADAAREALTQMQTPAVIVLDEKLPGTSGSRFLAELRASGCEVPVISISAYNDPTQAERVLALGASAFLQKPFGIRLLIETIEAVLSGSTASSTCHPEAAPTSP